MEVDTLMTAYLDVDHRFVRNTDIGYYHALLNTYSLSVSAPEEIIGQAFGEANQVPRKEKQSVRQTLVRSSSPEPPQNAHQVDEPNSSTPVDEPLKSDDSAPETPIVNSSLKLFDI